MRVVGGATSASQRAVGVPLCELLRTIVQWIAILNLWAGLGLCLE